MEQRQTDSWTLGHFGTWSRSFPPRHDLLAKCRRHLARYLPRKFATIFGSSLNLLLKQRLERSQVNCHQIDMRAEPVGDGRQHPPGMAAWDWVWGLETGTGTIRRCSQLCACVLIAMETS